MMSSAEEADPGPSRALGAVPLHPVEPAGLRIGTVFYLVSVGLIAVATLGASLGLGFYLLVHPPEDAASEPARISGGSDGSLFAVAINSSAADAELSVGDKIAAVSQPETVSPTSEASAPIPSAPREGQGEGDTLSSLREAARLAVQDIAPDTNPPPVERERPDQDREQVGGPSKPTLLIIGPVTDVRDVATWVVDGRTVRLFGIDPGPAKHLASLVNWVRAKGAVECLLQWPTQLYRCFTATGEDIAEAALLAGIGRAGEGATVAYQSAESNARRMGKGLWARR
jgi:endonuclease YncB( thermonuclease family)